MAQLNLPWSHFKTIVGKRTLTIEYLDVETGYYLYAFDKNFEFNTSIQKDAGPDQTDFEKNHKTSAIEI
jgi:hypothetical protein